MLTRRIIPCLDIKEGRVVKGVRFAGLRDAGDPAERAALYERQGADEIVILDVSATPEGRGAAAATVDAVRRVLSIPVTVGGGVRSLDDALRLLNAGADKVAVNTAAVERPELIGEIASRVGRQCTVLAMDASHLPTRPEAWEVVTHCGRHATGIEASWWAARAAELGAGEILLTSVDQDGVGCGYDLGLLRAITCAIDIPVIASGGASSAAHMAEAFSAGADAVLAASIFHDGDTTVGDIKQVLRSMGLEMRL